MRAGRRDFIQGALAGGLALMAPRSARAAECRIEVLAEEPIGTISPNPYGHFVEHLGGVVYDGIWVGEGSKVPNVGGLRRALVEQVRRIKPGVARWPGGCFADSYGQASALTADDIHAHNSFDQPRAVAPAGVRVEAQRAGLVHRFPPASVSRLQLVLA